MNNPEPGLQYGFVGLGLIGGSMARALKKADASCQITACARSEATLHEAMRAGVVDQAAAGAGDPLFGGCDVIFLCAPVGVNIEAMKALKGHLKEGALLTDVGSVKTPIHEAACELSLQEVFIGGHPMAGSERSGFDASNDHLFENAYYILTPGKDTPEALSQRLTRIVRACGAIPMVMDCREHDHITAAVSHLPHLVAAALVNTVRDLDGPEQYMKTIAAGGFKDITRIASSSPDMWEHILVSNREPVSEVTDAFLDHMIRALEQIRSRNGSAIHEMFEESREYRGSLPDTHAGAIPKNYRIYCDVIDEAGAIATIATLLAVKLISIRNIGIVHNREFEEGALAIEFYAQEDAREAAAILRHHRYRIWET